MYGTVFMVHGQRRKSDAPVMRRDFFKLVIIILDSPVRAACYFWLSDSCLSQCAPRGAPAGLHHPESGQSRKAKGGKDHETG